MSVPVEWVQMTVAIDLKARESMGDIEDRARLQMQVATGGREEYSHLEWSQLYRAAILEQTASGEFTLSLPIAVTAGTDLPLGLELAPRRGRQRGLNAALRRDDDAAQRVIQQFLRRTQLSAQALEAVADLANKSTHIDDDLHLFSKSHGVNADFLLKFLSSKGEPFSMIAAKTRVEFKRHLIRALAPQDDIRRGIVQPVGRLLQGVKIEGVVEEDVEGPPRRLRPMKRRGEQFVMTTGNLRTAMILNAAAVLGLPIQAAWQGGRKLKGARPKAQMLQSIENLKELAERVAAAALSNDVAVTREGPEQLPLLD